MFVEADRERHRPMKPLSLPHLTRLPAAHADPGPHAVYPTILALHGRGSNEHDLIGLADYLPQDFLWISPRGPFDLGPDSYEWFQISQIGKPDPTRLANALGVIDTFIHEIIANYPVDLNKLYLLGFSQGTILSLSYVLTRPQEIAGVIAQSGYIPHESGLIIDEAGLKNKPILLTHGIQDPMLPVGWARRSRDTLQSLGTDLEYHEFNMAHNVSAESLAVINTWLGRQRP
jgi:phospholipase/carboxylesterase